MSAAGREGLTRIFGSPTYLTWASRLGNVIDARKLALEFQGTRRPTAGDPFARGLQILCRENPPLGPGPVPPPDPDPDPDPPPPSAGVLDPLWKRDAVYTVALSSFSGTVRNEAKRQGYSAVYVQLLHPAAPDANNELEIPVFRKEGWVVCGWGTYGQGSDPEKDGRDAALLVKRLGLAGWKANGEAWAENEHSWKTEAFLIGWHAENPGKPLGWSVLSSDTANFARGYAYGVALSVPGADIDIQVYGSTHPTYTVGAGLGMLAKANVPVARTAMTFDVNAEGFGPFADYRTWQGPRRVWTGDVSRVGTFQQLSRSTT